MHEEPHAPARTTAPHLPPCPAPPPAGHSTTTTERGSFCLARCTCGWAGPARRSRDRARTDAAEHLAAS
ncbi:MULTISPECIES: hypothetical protein [Streptomyces]|uniref:hypothetical protein n=1 Tax=Streptomyces TaxID=1883 RepID=UPI000D51A6E5|nr:MULTISPECIES: hypothetical protein [Streptomyces]MXG24130.1 hypothetical protein [Streptomyces sp. YIM 132580]PVC70202.1 hypothetical protein DBP15_13950 [Streptomyces sp. CS065A]